MPRPSIPWEEFLRRVNISHGPASKYSYIKDSYKGMAHPVDIVCPLHGIFRQVASLHSNGNGCPSCKADRTSIRCKKTTLDFIRQSILFHGSFYDYSKVKYLGSYDKVTIICPRHGEFQQEPRHHLNHGCKECSKGNLYKKYYKKPTTLYYVRLDFPDKQDPLYKIGITTRSIQDRFNQDSDVKITTLLIGNFDTGKRAFMVEQFILTLFSGLRYKGPDILKSGGNSELFIRDIFQ